MDENKVSIFQRWRGHLSGLRGHLPGPKRKTWLGLLLLLYVLGGVGMGAVFASHVLSSSPAPKEPIAASDSTQLSVEIPAVTAPASDDEAYEVPHKAPSDPRLSFLLLGYGGVGHDGAFLTDSITLAVADPNQKTLTLLSIPRDCWVPLLFGSKTAIYSKVNTAYALAKDNGLYRERLDRYRGEHGAGNLAADTVSRLLGLPISNYLALDFDGFRQMIDVVGGIDVEVPVSFSASYPANDNPAIDSSWTVVRFAKGVQHMGGERAMQFARAREVFDNVSEGTDFARSRRQRLIMEAFQKRMLEAGGLIRLPQILAIAARHVDTDYPVMEAGQLGQFILGWKDMQIYQTALTTSNYLSSGTGPEGAYVVVPSAADHTWAQVRAFARRLWEDPAAGVAMAETQIVIMNDTGEPGAAARLSAALSRLGYRVGIPMPGQGRAESRLIDRSGGTAAPLAALLQQDLGIQVEVVTEAPIGGSPVLVLDLGRNDKNLADLSVPPDSEAPSSTYGVQNFETWLPYVPDSPVEGAEDATPSATAADVAAAGTSGPTDGTEDATPSAGSHPRSTPKGGATPTADPRSHTTPGSTAPATGTAAHPGTPPATGTPAPQRSPAPSGPPPTVTAVKTSVPTARPSATPQP